MIWKVAETVLMTLAVSIVRPRMEALQIEKLAVMMIVIPAVGTIRHTAYFYSCVFSKPHSSCWIFSKPHFPYRLFSKPYFSKDSTGFVSQLFMQHVSKSFLA